MFEVEAVSKGGLSQASSGWRMKSGPLNQRLFRLSSERGFHEFNHRRDEVTWAVFPLSKLGELQYLSCTVSTKICCILSDPRIHCKTVLLSVIFGSESESVV